METNQAAENLQVIRTLMERSALYRRALAPVMLLVGAIGLAATITGMCLAIQTDAAFLRLWLSASAVAIVSAFLLIRRQSFKDAEPLWTPPTRRVVGAMTPPIVFGAVISLLFVGSAGGHSDAANQLPPVWMALYGCGLHAAGFFMQRGIKWLGWLFLVCGSALLFIQFGANSPAAKLEVARGNLAMGATFGALHFAYGIYLYFTESRKNVA